MKPVASTEAPRGQSSARRALDTLRRRFVTPVVTALAIAVATAALYAWRLQDAPIYLSPDEAIISVDAYSIASTGRDVHGRFLPLFFQIQLPGETRMGWFTPAIFYLSALFLKVLPLSEATIRLPAVLVGVGDGGLMDFIGRRVFKPETCGVVASPPPAPHAAHFLLRPLPVEVLYP